LIEKNVLTIRAPLLQVVTAFFNYFKIYTSNEEDPFQFWKMLGVIHQCFQVLFDSFGDSFRPTIENWIPMLVTLLSTHQDTLTKKHVVKDLRDFESLVRFFLTKFSLVLNQFPSTKKILSIVSTKLFEPLVISMSWTSNLELKEQIRRQLREGLFHSDLFHEFHLSLLSTTLFGNLQEENKNSKEDKNESKKDYDQKIKMAVLNYLPTLFSDYITSIQKFRAQKESSRISTKSSITKPNQLSGKRSLEFSFFIELCTTFGFAQSWNEKNKGENDESTNETTNLNETQKEKKEKKSNQKVELLEKTQIHVQDIESYHSLSLLAQILNILIDFRIYQVTNEQISKEQTEFLQIISSEILLQMKGCLFINKVKNDDLQVLDNFNFNDILCLVLDKLIQLNHYLLEPNLQDLWSFLLTCSLSPEKESLEKNLITVYSQLRQLDISFDSLFLVLKEETTLRLVEWSNSTLNELSNAFSFIPSGQGIHLLRKFFSHTLELLPISTNFVDSLNDSSSKTPSKKQKVSSDKSQAQTSIPLHIQSQQCSIILSLLLSFLNKVRILETQQELFDKEFQGFYENYISPCFDIISSLCHQTENTSKSKKKQSLSTPNLDPIIRFVNLRLFPSYSLHLMFSLISQTYLNQNFSLDQEFQVLQLLDTCFTSSLSKELSSFLFLMSEMCIFGMKKRDDSSETRNQFLKFCFNTYLEIVEHHPLNQSAQWNGNKINISLSNLEISLFELYCCNLSVLSDFLEDEQLEKFVSFFIYLLFYILLF